MFIFIKSIVLQWGNYHWASRPEKNMEFHNPE